MGPPLDIFERIFGLAETSTATPSYFLEDFLIGRNKHHHPLIFLRGFPVIGKNKQRHPLIFLREFLVSSKVFSESDTFSIPKIFETDTDTFFDTKFFRNRYRYFFRYQNFLKPIPIPLKKYRKTVRGCASLNCRIY